MRAKTHRRKKRLWTDFFEVDISFVVVSRACRTTNEQFAGATSVHIHRLPYSNIIIYLHARGAGGGGRWLP